MRLRLFESFEEGVLGGEIEGVGRRDEEEALGCAAGMSELEEITQLFNGDDLGLFIGVGAEDEWMR